MPRCVKCLLPDRVPGADLDRDGVCHFCRSHSTAVPTIDPERQRVWKEDLERTLKEVRGKSRYDVLVCMSGGKDSLYLLYKAKVEYGLNVLAFTTDVNLPPIAWRNISTSRMACSVST